MPGCHITFFCNFATNYHIMRRILSALVCLAAAISSAASDYTPFIDHSKPERLLNFDIHALLGGVTVTQNYRSCFPQISEMAITTGVSTGAGATAHAAITNFISLGTEVNFLINYYRMNLAVADDDATSITDVFVRNHFYTLNFPVYITLDFNLGGNVKWNVDAGGYYSYGLSGSSKSTLYSAQVNPMGQLITTYTNGRADYYNSEETFITSFYRGDYGLHLATGLMFRQRVKVGVRMQIGFKNVANTFDAVRRPNTHNFNFFGTLGWCF